VNCYSSNPKDKQKSEEWKIDRYSQISLQGNKPNFIQMETFVTIGAA
jgi:hypothetical protein